jgi:hypothetical protein
VWFGGRVYSRAVLHTGATLKLRDVWVAGPPPVRAEATTPEGAVGANDATTSGRTVADRSRRRFGAIVIVMAVVVGGIVILATSDVIIGIAVGAAVYAVGTRLSKSSPAKHSHSSSR